MILDIIFVFIFLGLEVLYYKSFRKHEEEVRNDLLAISERLELLIEAGASGLDKQDKKGDSKANETINLHSVPSFFVSRSCSVCGSNNTTSPLNSGNHQSR